MPYDLHDLGRFGVRADDEGTHPSDATEPSWNESVFYDFVAGPTCAGHIRVGRMEGQGRAWIWAFFFVDGEWAAIEAPWVPLSRLSGFDVTLPGLSVVRRILEPLRVDTLRIAGRARRVRGPRAGSLVMVDADLRYEARGPAHSLGVSNMPGHDGGELGASRFEQPMAVTGSLRIDDRTLEISGTGERDHSWGPRAWNMEWTFLVAHGEDFRFQCARVVFDEDTFLCMGYLGRAETVGIVDVESELLRLEDSGAAYRGRVRFETDTGEQLAGTIEPISACEIDASHAFDPPTPSTYSRTLVRFVLDDGSAALGWLEVNRFPHGIPGAGA